MCMGKDLLHVNIQLCQKFPIPGNKWKTTNDRMSVQTGTLETLQVRMKWRITLLFLLTLTLGIRNYISNLHVHGVVIKTIIQSLWATERIKFTFNSPPPLAEQ